MNKVWTVIKFAPAVSFVCSPLIGVGIASPIYGWSPIQETGAMMLACAISPCLFPFVFIFFDRG